MNSKAIIRFEYNSDKKIKLVYYDPTTLEGSIRRIRDIEYLKGEWLDGVEVKRYKPRKTFKVIRQPNSLKEMCLVKMVNNRMLHRLKSEIVHMPDNERFYANRMWDLIMDIIGDVRFCIVFKDIYWIMDPEDSENDEANEYSLPLNDTFSNFLVYLNIGGHTNLTTLEFCYAKCINNYKCQ